MHHDIDLILTFTGALSAALMLGFVTQRLRLSPIVGYLLAGVVVGPFTPGFVADSSLSSQFAELGVILLMFGVGLHFDIAELLAVRKVAVPGAVAQIAVATGLGVLLTHTLGWSVTSGVVFGLAISVASTVVLLRVLADNDSLHTPAGHVAVGWLIVEDLFTVMALVLLPVLAHQGDSSAGGIALEIVGALLKMAGLVLLTTLFGKRTIPVLLHYVAKTRSRELFTLTVLVTALSIAVGSALVFGVSMALGAFLAGTVVRQSEFSARAASEALPLRDAFAVLFFVSMGMLVDPAALLVQWKLTVGTLLVVLVGKPLAALVVVLLLRQPAKTAVSVAIALAQVGEFSFLLAAAARPLNLLPEEATQSLVAASVVSITLNPLLYRLVDPIARRLSSSAVSSASLANHLSDQTEENRSHRAIVVGYGPVGRSLAALLRENSIEPTIVELNSETVRRLRSQGMSVVHGDASHPGILESAGVRLAKSLAFSASGELPEAGIQIAKELNPDIVVIARATFASDTAALVRAGAHYVISAEREVALAMTERLLGELGATADQLDRARDRVRESIGNAA
jgi:CPA2 family monovalent cation:H+ antiporter-2